MTAKSFVMYRATNAINGKSYIGITANLRQRKLGHKSSAKTKKTRFAKAIAKHGFSSFIFDVMGNYPTWNAACNAEIQAIAEFKPQYNITLGGEGFLGVERKTFSVVCLHDGRFFRSVYEASKFYSIREKTIREVLAGRQHVTGGKAFVKSDVALSSDIRLGLLDEVHNKMEAWRLRRLRGLRKRAVTCVKTGETYSSAASAARSIGLTEGRVAQICNGGGTTASGLIYKWSDSDYTPAGKRFSEEHYKNAYAKRDAALKRAHEMHKKRVLREDTGEVFDSLCDAANSIGVSFKLISAGILRNGKTRGIKFRYLEGRQ